MKPFKTYMLQTFKFDKTIQIYSKRIYNFSRFILKIEVFQNYELTLNFHIHENTFYVKLYLFNLIS
jgi:hypothetical protein